MEHLHPTPPRRSSRRAAIDANARLTAMLTPARGRHSTASVSVSSAARQQIVAAAVEETVASAEFRDVDDSPSLGSVESTDAEELECCICLEESSADDVATIDGCDHKFCLGCITEWSETRNICPLCRSRFTTIESAGGVLQQVPDRRPVTLGINLVRIFNLEEIASNEDVFATLRQSMAELQEMQRRQMQRMQPLIQGRNERIADLIEPRASLPQEVFVRRATEQAVQAAEQAARAAEQAVEQARQELDQMIAERNQVQAGRNQVQAERNQLQADLEQLSANLRSM